MTAPSTTAIDLPKARISMPITLVIALSASLLSIGGTWGVMRSQQVAGEQARAELTAKVEKLTDAVATIANDQQLIRQRDEMQQQQIDRLGTEQSVDRTLLNRIANDVAVIRDRIDHQAK